jgi:hypothetical protein
MGSTETDAGAPRRRRWQAGSAAALLAIVGCASQPSQQVSSGERCMASCSRPAADGESCLAWAALAPEACVNRFSAALSCCGPGERRECALAVPMSTGTPCVCRGADPRGAFVVQGSACQAP